MKDLLGSIDSFINRVNTLNNLDEVCFEIRTHIENMGFDVIRIGYSGQKKVHVSHCISQAILRLGAILLQRRL